MKKYRIKTFILGPDLHSVVDLMYIDSHYSYGVICDESNLDDIDIVKHYGLLNIKFDNKKNLRGLMSR